jgi:hypothetical protein
MTTPDAALAEWLQSQSRLTSAEDAATAAAFGDEAAVSTILSPYALKADADAEAARGLAFLKLPAVEEHIDVDTTAAVETIIGRCVTITAPSPGYEAGALVYVVGGDRDRASGAIMLNVLRRL